MGGVVIVALAVALQLAGFSGATSTRAVTIALVGVALVLLIKGVRTANGLQRSRNSQSVEDSFKGENFP